MFDIIQDKLWSLTKRRRDFIWLLFICIVAFFITTSFIGATKILAKLIVLEPDLLSQMKISITLITLSILGSFTFVLGVMFLGLSVITLTQQEIN